jgi:hypothetical protein
MPVLTPEERYRRIKMMVDAAAVGVSLRDCARRLGIDGASLRRWAVTLRAQYGSLDAALADAERRLAVIATPGVAPSPPQSAPVLTPSERHSLAFWRARAESAERERDRAVHLAEQLAGLRNAPLDPPPWSHAPPSEPSRSIVIAHTSDLHMGEVIAPREVEGINRYDPDVARERLRRYFDAVVHLGPKWVGTDACDGVLLTLAGDLIAGDIHEDLARTNALTSTEAVTAAAACYVSGIRQLLEHFSAVHVVAVPGNHGRTTARPPVKLVARLSYDMLCAQMVRDALRDENRVTWTLSAAIDARVPVYGRTIVVTHGDRYAKGGQGLTGPGLPAIRGAARVRQQAAAAGLGCDLLLIGHFHTSMMPGGVLVNGSIVGYSEYAHGLRVAVEPPQQWLARFSARWGLCEMRQIRLDDPPEGVRWRQKST